MQSPARHAFGAGKYRTGGGCAVGVSSEVAVEPLLGVAVSGQRRHQVSCARLHVWNEGLQGFRTQKLVLDRAAKLTPLPAVTAAHRSAVTGQRSQVRRSKVRGQLSAATVLH